MSITMDELKDFAGNSALKDVRTLNELIIDLLTPQQIAQIDAYFEKSLSLKPKPPQNKKVAQKPQNTPKMKVEKEMKDSKDDFPPFDDDDDDSDDEEVEQVDWDSNDDNVSEDDENLMKQAKNVVQSSGRHLTQDEINAIIEGNIPKGI